MKFFSGFSFVALCLFVMTACSDSTEQTAASDGLYAMRISQTHFAAKLALTDAQRARGLMGVKSMPQNEGMLFVYSEAQKMSFWMKNTFIPLDLAFMDSDGKILEIKSLWPHSLDAVASSSDEVMYCLEMNAGWFAKRGIKAGDRLDLNLLKKALEGADN